ncbi:hypothetical protein [Homoserinibacter sp. YIM 151385]|uniref:hypothetical protein n=1 Tax=Homoserinibacter sp. YIM 151385 TaxID=2985506 RepID=UPI0022F058BC|nr:hypothetical protein [Homoserinibacter sp. YIM 151385]WBU38285.1 hypothetical protein OF852_01500 [Homoserinibacter sp. YIM 151385]
MSAAPILTLALRYGGILAGAVAVLGSIVGFLVAGMPGLAAALIAAGAVALFLGLTAASILIAARVTAGDPGSPLFFGIVLGAWLLKLVLFLVLTIWLRGQAWLDPYVFFVTVVVAVLGSLVVDVLAFQRARVPYVSDAQEPEKPLD